MISRNGTKSLTTFGVRVLLRAASSLETKKLLYINTMSRLQNCIPLYVGCETNKGTFIGIVKNSLFIQNGEHSITEYSKQSVGQTVFLHLKRLSDITDEQSQQLNKKGFNIGRPSGYTFSNDAFLYLLSLHVDLFGLINAGMAKGL